MRSNRLVAVLAVTVLARSAAALAETPADQLRLVPTPNGCVLILDQVSADYRLDRLVDGGVTVSLFGAKLGAAEREMPGSCLASYRVSAAYDGSGSVVEVRPSGVEFAGVIRTGSRLELMFERVAMLGGGGGKDDQTARLYRIGVGDLLQISVYNHPDLTTQARIGADGTFTYSLLGTLQAAGRTVAELQSQIASDLGKSYIVNPQVSLDVKEYASQFVMVSGSVKNPGRIALQGGTTLKDALFVAGGFAPNAGYSVVVARTTVGSDGLPRDPEKMQFARADIEAGRANLDLRPGDVITVSEKDYFYIQNEVREPGKYELEPGMTVLRAVAVAKGLTDWADRRHVVLIRSVGGETQRRVINLKDVEKMKTADVTLAADDIIIVPRRFL